MFKAVSGLKKLTRNKAMGLLLAGVAVTASAGLITANRIASQNETALRMATIGYNTPGYTPPNGQIYGYTNPTAGYQPPSQPINYQSPGYIPPMGYQSPGYVPPVRQTPGYTPPSYQTPGYVAPYRPQPTPGYTPPSYATPGYVAPVRQTPTYKAPAKTTAKPVVKPKTTTVIPAGYEKIPAPWRIGYYTKIRQIGNSLYGILKK